MAHTLANQTKVAIGTAVKNEVEAGTGTAVLKLMNAGKTATYATLNLPNTCGTVNATTGVLTFDCSPALSDSSVSAGTTTIGRITDRDGGTVIDDITVGIGTSFEINLTNNVFAGGEAVQITSLTWTPPSGG